MLTQGRLIQERDGKLYSFPLAANAVVFQGSLAMLTGGALEAACQQATAGAAAACVVVGVVEKIPPADPSLPALRIPVRAGCFLFQNSAGGDAVTLSNVGQPAYAVDDQTVALTSSNNLRPLAGTIVDVESDGVWVRVGVH